MVVWGGCKHAGSEPDLNIFNFVGRWYCHNCWWEVSGENGGEYYDEYNIHRSRNGKMIINKR